MDSHKRSIVKALSWRFIATIITAGIAYAIWGSAGGALKIGLADLVIKLIVYYGHERVWLKIPYGQPKTAEYEI